MVSVHTNELFSIPLHPHPHFQQHWITDRSRLIHAFMLYKSNSDSNIRKSRVYHSPIVQCGISFFVLIWKKGSPARPSVALGYLLQGSTLCSFRDVKNGYFRDCYFTYFLSISSWTILSFFCDRFRQQGISTHWIGASLEYFCFLFFWLFSARRWFWQLKKKSYCHGMKGMDSLFFALSFVHFTSKVSSYVWHNDKQVCCQFRVPFILQVMNTTK